MVRCVSAREGRRCCLQSCSYYQGFNSPKSPDNSNTKVSCMQARLYCIWPKTFSPITSFPGCQNHSALAVAQKGATTADLEWNSWKFGRGMLERCRADLLCSLADIFGTRLCGSGTGLAAGFVLLFTFMPRCSWQKRKETAARAFIWLHALIMLIFLPVRLFSSVFIPPFYWKSHS